MRVSVAIYSPSFLKRIYMASGRKYFYALGQRCRAKGLTKSQGEALYHIDSALPYASIYFDKGYRGLSL
jgi:hypothetical protein